MLLQCTSTALLPHQLNCGLQELVKAIFHIEKHIIMMLLLRLDFTCTADEHVSAEADTTPAACMDPDGQRFDQSPLLISHIIRQPGSRTKKKCQCYAR